MTYGGGLPGGPKSLIINGLRCQEKREAFASLYPYFMMTTTIQNGHVIRTEDCPSFSPSPC